MKKCLILGLLACSLVLSSCILDPVKSESKRNTELFLQGFLSANGPVTNVKLRKTIPPDQYYDFMPLGGYAVSGAYVVVTENSNQHVLAETSSGTYGNASLVARPGVTYVIEVTFPAGHEFAGRRLTASTTVPTIPQATVTINPFYIARGAQITGRTLTGLEFPRELAYPDSFGFTSEKEPFKLTWSNAAAPAGYFIAATADDTTGTGLLREREYSDWKDGDFSDPMRRQGTRAGGYYVMPDSTQTSAFWLLFNYKGWYDVAVVACDKPYWDYMLTVFNDAGMGADSDAGVVLNVRGGLGVFCSYASDTIRTYVQPDWLPSSR
jgi:hypothetical protein